MSVFIFCTHQWSLSLPLNNQKPDIVCVLSSHLYFWYWLHRGRIFPLVPTWRWHFLVYRSCHIYQFNINALFFISCKLYVMFIKLAYRRWSTDLLDLLIIKEKKLGGFQRWKLFFFVTGWFMSYFHLLPFVDNKKHVEGETNQFFVFVYFFAFNFAPNISPLELCW